MGLEEVLAELIERVRAGGAEALDEFSRFVGFLSVFYLLGSGVGLHGFEAAEWLQLQKWLVTISIEALAATAPYLDWLERQLDRFIDQEFFRDAGHLQNRVMCEIPTLPKGLRVHAISRPRQRVSGDLVLVTPVGREAWFAIGDVTGHGVAAAIYSALLLYVFQLARMRTTRESRSEPLVAVARMINHEIITHKMGNVSFPVILGRAVPRKRLIEVINCGSPATPLLLRDGASIEIHEGSVALGQFAGIAPTIWCRMWEEGDLLILPTDGIVEQRNAEGEMYSNKRLAARAKALSDREPKEVANAIFDALDQFAGAARQGDDQTLLVVRLGG
jgi:sigma-B regulation protein RsbU (phosphoserine phosphatase)